MRHLLASSLHVHRLVNVLRGATHNNNYSSFPDDHHLAVVV